MLPQNSCFTIIISKYSVGKKTVKQDNAKQQLWVFLNKKIKIVSDSLSMLNGIHSESVCFELILTWIDC